MHPLRSTQDSRPLLRLARSRCADQKAGVRKAALQLLEAALLLRARAGASLGPRDGRLSEPMTPQDAGAVEAAAADPLVQRATRRKLAAADCFD
jgi:hypothetical protein